MKARRVTAHAFVLRYAIKAVESNGKGGYKGLAQGLRIIDHIEAQVAWDEKILPPWARFLPEDLDALEKEGLEVDPNDVRSVDLLPDDYEYLQEAAREQAEKAKPAEGKAVMALKKALETASEVEYLPPEK